MYIFLVFEFKQVETIDMCRCTICQTYHTNFNGLNTSAGFVCLPCLSLSEIKEAKRIEHKENSDGSL